MSTPTTIFTYREGATARRQVLLRAVQNVVPGLKYKRFDYDRPSRFTVTVAGKEVVLTLSQVEVFAAAFRMGFLLGQKKLREEDVAAIAVHEFADTARQRSVVPATTK